MQTRGFSLVELSIVLVILGLLTGGILAGQSLIRASELRAVSVEYSRYVTAAQSFRDKYFAYPGDFSKATQFWGRLNSNADCVTNSSAAVATPGACDGNMDGQVTAGGTASTSTESFQFWRHLANAGLIEGSYTGIAGPNTGWAGNDAVLGTNTPRSKLSGGGWGIFYNNAAGDTATYKNNYGNMLIFGAQNPGNYPTAATLKPEEAWNIDTKLDDGKPGTGKIWAWPFINNCTTSASNTDYAGAYALSTTSVVCALWFANAF